MKHLTRFLCLLLAMTLMLPCAMAETADALPSDDVIESLGSVDKLALWDGKLVAHNYGGLYQQAEGGWTQLVDYYAHQSEGSYFGIYSMAMGKDAPYLLLSQNDEKYLISRIEPSGDAYTLTQVAQISWDFDPAESWINIYSFLIEGSEAYILAYVEDGSSDWGLNTLYRVNLQDGTTTTITRDYITQLIPGDENAFYGVYWNQMEAYQEDGTVKLPSLTKIDPASGTVTPLCDMPDTSTGGLVFADGYIYASNQTNVMRIAAPYDAWETVGYLLPSYGRDSASAIIVDGQYLVSDWYDETGMASASIDPEKLPQRTLRIVQNYSLDNQIRAFAKANPDIAIEYAEMNAYDAQGVTQHMQSAQAADIYDFYLSIGYLLPLRDKGYLADLSSSAALTEAVSAMYPNLTRELLVDGKLYALPYSLYAQSLGYYPETLETVGLTEEDLPTTYMELLEFIENWYYDYFEEYENVQLFDSMYDLHLQLFSLIFTQQILTCEAEGDMLTFNTPTIRALLQKLDSMKDIFDEMYPQDDESTAIGGIFYAYDDYASTSYLFSTYADATLYDSAYSMYNAAPLLLTLEEGTPPYINAGTQVLAVNPASKNQDIALQFLEYVAANLDDSVRIGLMPGENEPVPNDNYEDQIAMYDEAIESMKAELETIDEADRRDYEDMIAQMEAYKAEISPWSISAETITEYRTRGEYLYCPADNVFSGDTNEASKLMQQYVDGLISAEQFIQQFDRIVRMMQMEDY
ncbi:MAG: extracellular solute-binding protein [Clostridia bacterium]|nr:extracellular solute-binding protein [Clostridia bacterium]